jgi:hypothetical protein
MPKFEIEIDDKGEFLGTLPAEMSTILDKLKTTAHGEGFGKGSAKAAEEAKKQIEDAVRAEKLKLEQSMPLERAKWDGIEQDNKHLKSQLETTLTEQRKRSTEIAEAHATEITQRAAALSKRDGRIRELVNASLRTMASAAGARDESLAELEVILQHRIGYDDDMQPFVRAEDGTAAKTTAGNPLPIDQFVKQYLDNHPHHRKPAPGRGGDARGGASLHGSSARTSTVSSAQARERIDGGDRSLDAINELFIAGRKTA